jgi:type II secretory pathway component GspD/PulD (secretin)
MADPLSLTAAAAGFVGLAGQLAQGVIKLREIYTTVKDAPKDVAGLCTKMESLQAVLEDVGDQIQQLSQGNVKIDTGTFRDVVAQCEAARYRVEAHVKNINDGIRHNKGTAVRYVFKKKEIKEMLSDVEQCKTSVIIARQSIDGYVSILLVCEACG